MKKYLNASQIAKLEDVNQVTAVNWVREGKFENARKVGREYRVPIESYRKWRESTIIPHESERTNERSEDLQKTA